jgi:hypothetical protein
MVLAPFSRITKEVDRSFVILDASNARDIVYRLESIGPLRLIGTGAAANPTMDPMSSSTPPAVNTPAVSPSETATMVPPTSTPLAPANATP